MYIDGQTDKYLHIYMRILAFCLQYKISAVLKGHTGPINSVAAITITNTTTEKNETSCSTYIVTASADSTVIVWYQQGHEGQSMSIYHNGQSRSIVVHEGQSRSIVVIKVSQGQL